MRLFCLLTNLSGWVYNVVNMITRDMTNQIKKAIKQLTGFDYIAVRKGTGSMRGKVLVFCSCDNKITFKPFEEQIKALFPVYRVGYDCIEIDAWKI